MPEKLEFRQQPVKNTRWALEHSWHPIEEPQHIQMHVQRIYRGAMLYDATDIKHQIQDQIKDPGYRHQGLDRSPQAEGLPTPSFSGLNRLDTSTSQDPGSHRPYDPIVSRLHVVSSFSELAYGQVRVVKQPPLRDRACPSPFCMPVELYCIQTLLHACRAIT